MATTITGTTIEVTGDITLTSAGSIKTQGTDILLGTADTGIRFYDQTSSIYPVNVTSSSDRDNAVDLGHPSVRFKDAYLSGGAFLGGTATANKLEDYETGSWTPTIVLGSLTIAVIEAANYTKIGNVVVLQAYLTLANNGDSTLMNVGGLPFVNGGTGGNANQYSMGVVAHQTGANTAEMKYCRTQSNASYVSFYKKASTHIAQSDVDGGYFLFSVTYRTAA